MAQNDRVRNGLFAGLTQGAADLAAAAQQYGGEWGGRLGQQVLDAAKAAAKAHQDGQGVYGQAVLDAHGADSRQNPVVQHAMGKVRAAPYTAAGLLATPGMALGSLLSGQWPGVHVGDNALQILNAPIDRAFTLGNVQFYPPRRGPSTQSGGPDAPTHSYSGAWMRTGDHEGGHSDQYEHDGLAFLPKWIAGGAWSDTNPLELDADRRGLERAKRRSGK